MSVYLLVIVSILSLIRAWKVDNYYRMIENQSERDILGFINNISVDDFWKLLYIVPLASKPDILDKKRESINSLTYIIYMLILTFLLLMVNNL